jgi:hypothetical protein
VYGISRRARCVKGKGVAAHGGGFFIFAFLRFLFPEA